MGREKYLIAVAAGKGLRMGGELPKQFVELEGRAILHRTIESFVDACPDIKVVTVLNPDWVSYWKEYCYSHAMVVRQRFVPGGITRFHSVRNALEVIPRRSETFRFQDIDKQAFRPCRRASGRGACDALYGHAEKTRKGGW